MYSQDDLYGDPYSAPSRGSQSAPSGPGSVPSAMPPSGPRPERRAVRNAAAFASDYDEG